MPRIVRRQAVGAASGTGQAVSMGTATSGSTCSPVTPRKLGRTLSPCTTWSIHGAVRMAMARYLARGQRRAADSAGNTRPPPSTPRLTGLRRGSHNGQHSTVAGCRRPQSWPRKGYAYGTESHRRRWWSRSPPRYQFPRRQNRQRHSPYLALYVYGWPTVLPSASCCRQCRKHPAITSNPVSAASQTRIT